MSDLSSEAAHTSEMSDDIQLRTYQYILEDSELHTRRHENLKSHKEIVAFLVIQYLPGGTEKNHVCICVQEMVSMLILYF
jgi:hypothetical protein